MFSWSETALQGLVSFVVTVLSVPLARRIALSLGVTDKPAPGKMHRAPTPYLGGVAIGAGALAAALLSAQVMVGWSRVSLAVLAGGLLMALVGLVDDLRNLSPLVKLLPEAVAASIIVAAGVHVQLFDSPLDWVVTVIWIVVITNSFNLLDNMDGAAGTVGAITAVAMVVAAGLEGQIIVGGLGAVVAGACLGFLPYNWHPARIFMGDAGSLFLGYVLSVLGIALRFDAGRLEGVVGIMLLAGPCVFDTSLVVLSRRLAGRPITVGGTDHTSHRLNRLGLRIPMVTSLLGAGAGLSAAIGIATGRGRLQPALAVAVMAAFSGWALVALLQLPVYELGGGRPLGERTKDD